MAVAPFHARVAELALTAAAAHGFALAGGNALAAHELLSRRTDDVDLFSPEPGATGQVLDAVVGALRQDGFEVQVLREPAEHGGEFAQLQVTRDQQMTQLDLGRDWRAHDAVTLEIGPVLHVDDAVGSKMTAMLGRGLPRDYIDIASTLNTYSRHRLLELAYQRDPGLRVADASLAMLRLDDLSDPQFAYYGLDVVDVAALRGRFDSWPRDGTYDEQARRAHKQV